VDHSLKTVVVDVITLPDYSVVTVSVAARTVIRSMIVTLSASSLDAFPWQCYVRNNRQYLVVNESDYKYNEIHINKGKDNGGLGCEMLAYNAGFLKNK
jgi:hypothetical protein